MLCCSLREKKKVFWSGKVFLSQKIFFVWLKIQHQCNSTSVLCLFHFRFRRKQNFSKLKSTHRPFLKRGITATAKPSLYIKLFYTLWTLLTSWLSCLEDKLLVFSFVEHREVIFVFKNHQNGSFQAARNRATRIGKRKTSRDSCLDSTIFATATWTHWRSAKRWSFPKGN